MVHLFNIITNNSIASYINKDHYSFISLTGKCPVLVFSIENNKNRIKISLKTEKLK